MRAHFWISEPAPDVDSWDPDAAPQRYSTGIGHNLYELYARLGAAGDRVSLGPVPRPDSSIVIAFAKSLRPLTAQLALLRSLGSRPLIMIRSDSDPAWHTRFVPDVEVMPYASAVMRPYQTWVPALPQRGLIRRSVERFGRIETVGFKGHRTNLPAFMRKPEWQRTLDSMGLRWLPDSPPRGEDSDQNWHDFSEVDVALCLRSQEVGRSSWKPATKLINAWCAGAVPLVGPEPAYLDLVTRNEDAFVVGNESDVLAVLQRLTTESDLLRATEMAIETRAKDFARDAVLDQWRELLRRRARTGLSAEMLRRRRWETRRISLLVGINRLRKRQVRREDGER